MSDQPLEQLDPQVSEGENPDSTIRIRKRDMLHGFLGVPKATSKEIQHKASDQSLDTFVSDTIKDSVEIAEIVALGPVLQKELYRKLRSSLVKDFDEARILDFSLLQGLVELVLTTFYDFLVSDDLIKIPSILRTRLQGTRRQSTEHPYHLSLHIFKVLDVMAEHKVKNLPRVLEHEPLLRVLRGLKGSSEQKPRVLF
ncbi:hypothetical protein BGW39_001901 [Mortierella sp. 14UC]|nr:hypothetical protein BGW39_001901 [Mortierella sp. 14UC]